MTKVSDISWVILENVCGRFYRHMHSVCVEFSSTLRHLCEQQRKCSVLLLALNNGSCQVCVTWGGPQSFSTNVIITATTRNKLERFVWNSSSNTHKAITCSFAFWENNSKRKIIKKQSRRRQHKVASMVWVDQAHVCWPVHLHPLLYSLLTTLTWPPASKTPAGKGLCKRTSLSLWVV